MKLEVAGAPQSELRGSGDDARSDASTTAPSEARKDAPSDAASDAPSMAPSDAPSLKDTNVPKGIARDKSSDASSNSASNATSSAPINLPNPSAVPSDGMTFHFQVAESEAAATAEPEGLWGVRRLRDRLQGWQCDMRAWAAAFVVSALLFVVLVVTLSFSLTDFTEIGRSRSVDSRHALEGAIPTLPTRRPVDLTRR